MKKFNQSIQKRNYFSFIILFGKFRIYRNIFV